MSRLLVSRTVAREEADRALRPRDGLILEREVAPGRFEAEEGPVLAYERVARIEDLGDGRARLNEEIRFRLAVPFFRWLFEIPVRRLLARGGGEPRAPWWAPAERVDARGASALAVLAVLVAIGGYLTGLLTITVAFAGRDLGAGPATQGVAGVGARFGAAIALFFAAAAADRLGRRRVIVASALAGCALTATGALSPSLPWLAASQAVARGFGVALLVCASIAAAEEMPRGSRAYAVSVLAMAGALGGGAAVALLPLADVASWGWRLLYVAPLAAVPLVVAAGGRLPETRRFVAPHPEAPLAGHGSRFWLLAASAILVNLMAAPASFFMNRYLIAERGFDAAAVAIFTLATGTPGVLGVVVGGRLADLRGRRPVGAVAVAGGTILTLWMYFSAGPALWAASALQSVVAAAGIPALGVYGPELFPTSLRGRMGGLLVLAGLAGSAAGLTVVGVVAGRIGALGPPIAALAVGPLALAVLVIAAYPETARRSLEDLNPEDRTAA